ncbi:class I adenylate-forming enzyme family protein [Aquabacterium sp.]|uniref:class I adenylate-forming enzyme family protein n=1 Tax=Aquabacterium sp. TaxID=1872578 RepID=UPI002BDEB1BE|nr:class I adenylate-forming enzyme family protein [Aquabacterium sp.]HSW08547.1 class I adenylate-forming enzyme family protein [Aquabacterium sp.]
MSSTAAAPTDTEPFRDLPSLLRDHARARPDAMAIHDAERSVRYAELDALADRVAATLQRDGLKAQDAIAICAGSSIDYLAVFLGALRVGVAVAPLAPSSTPGQLADMVADAGARLFFLDAAVAQALDAAQVVLPEALGRIRLGTAGDERSLADWLLPEGARPTPVAIDPAWAFNLIYSSGTTGTPKGIVQSHAMRWSHIQRAAVSGYGPDTVTLIATPLYSNTTLVAVIPTLAHGGTLVLMAKFDALRYLALAQQHRATHTMLVPVQYQRLMARPEFGQYDLSSFRSKFCTSAPFHPALKTEVLARWPGALVEYYGMTEGGGTCILQAHLFPNKLHTVGQPAEGHDIRLIDEEGREVLRGESGEVVGRSSGMMSGYHNQPGKTAEAEWFNKEGQRYIRTGDVGRFDEDGFLILHDRRKDMIISGGFNIYPSDLEAVLRRHPAVADAAVIGVPSVEWGETPVAFVVVRAGGTDSASAIREIQDWVNEQVGKTQRLSALRLIDELPRSAIGKILKRELRDRWTAASKG